MHRVHEVMQLFKVLFQDARAPEEEQSKESESTKDSLHDNGENMLKKEQNFFTKEEEGRNWNVDVFPLTYYMKQIESSQRKRYYMHKAEVSEKICIFDLSPKKLASILTQLDIMLIKNIKPKELVEYDGIEEKNDHVINNPCKNSNIRIVKVKHANITFLKNKNKGLINYVSFLLTSDKSQKYFLRVMKYLKAMNNYNSLDCISKSFQTHKLSTRNLEKLVRINKDIETYFDIRNIIEHLYEKKAVFIYPFDIFLKDVEDSNRFRNNEDASMRFCRLMEMLIELQNNYKHENMKYKYEHFLFSNFYQFINYRVENTKVEEKKENFLFLFL